MQNAGCRMQNYRFNVIPKKALPDVGISCYLRRLPHQSADWFAMTVYFDNFAFCILHFALLYIIFQFVYNYFSRGILTYGFHS